MLIATDLSAPARRAAEAALTLLPEVPATVIHAFETPFQKISTDPAVQIRAHGDTAARRLTDEIDALAVPTARLDGLTRIVLPGPADDAVATELARDHRVSYGMAHHQNSTRIRREVLRLRIPLRRILKVVIKCFHFLNRSGLKF